MVMNRRNSLPPLNEMTTVQVPRPYSVSSADGRWRHSGGGKCHPGRHQESAPTAASSRDSLAALNAMPVVQVSRPYGVSGADARLRYSGGGKCHNLPRAPMVLSAF